MGSGDSELGQLSLLVLLRVARSFGRDMLILS